MDALASLVPLLLLVGVFWLLIWRPQRRKQAALTSLRNSLEEGDDVLLAGGIYGEVAGVGDDSLQIEIAPDVQIRVHRDAVVAKQPEPVEETYDEGDDADGESGNPGDAETLDNVEPRSDHDQADADDGATRTSDKDD